MDRELRAGGVRVELNQEEKLPFVAGDSVQLQQVLINLIQNAIEAMRKVPDEKRRLQFEIQRNGAGLVEVCVSDSGEGISPEDAEKVFNPFYTSRDDGLGLGLSLSRSIVEAHGGNLSYSRNKSGGTTFSFTLMPWTDDH